MRTSLEFCIVTLLLILLLGCKTSSSSNDSQAKMATARNLFDSKYYFTNLKLGIPTKIFLEKIEKNEISISNGKFREVINSLKKGQEKWRPLFSSILEPILNESLDLQKQLSYIEDYIATYETLLENSWHLSKNGLNILKAEDYSPHGIVYSAEFFEELQHHWMKVIILNPRDRESINVAFDEIIKYGMGPHYYGPGPAHFNENAKKLTFPAMGVKSGSIPEKFQQFFNKSSRPVVLLTFEDGEDVNYGKAPDYLQEKNLFDRYSKLEGGVKFTELASSKYYTDKYTPGGGSVKIEQIKYIYGISLEDFSDHARKISPDDNF